MRIGICGGTFDPFHRGHLEPILKVREELEWDRVIYIPAHVQPFKQDRDFASGYHRFTMISLAILDHDALFASEIELERGRVSYSVETLQELRATWPHATIDWIIGDDNLAKLSEWKSLDRIFELANFVVLTRGGQTLLPAHQPRLTTPRSRPTHGTISMARNEMVPVSSTEIRKRVRDGEPIEDLVPPPVSRYIQHNGLYRKDES